MIFGGDKKPSCEEQLEQLRQKIRELEFTIARNPAKLDIAANTLEICGIKYSMILFDALGSFLPIGAVFELVDRKGDSLTVRHITNEIEIRRAVKALEEREERLQAGLAKIDAGVDPFHP